MQSLVFFMEPPYGKYEISLKAGIMCMNRFCIDEDDSFELFGCYDLQKPAEEVREMVDGNFVVSYDPAKGKVNYRK